VFWVFFKIGQCSAISFKRSRRELSIDEAEHGSMLKNFQNTHFSRLSFIPITGMAFPKTTVFTVYYDIQPRRLGAFYIRQVYSVMVSQ